MGTKDANLDALQAQYDDISKRLKTAKKTRDAQQRIAGKAVLEAIEDPSNSRVREMLLNILHRFVVNNKDREILGLEDLVKKMSAAA